MKKTLFLILSAITVLGLAGCSQPISAGVLQSDKARVTSPAVNQPDLDVGAADVDADVERHEGRSTPDASRWTPGAHGMKCSKRPLVGGAHRDAAPGHHLVGARQNVAEGPPRLAAPRERWDFLRGEPGFKPVGERADARTGVDE